jgi:hypothetical protein
MDTAFLKKRETGLEPATNGLEGRDSTIELLPHGLLYRAIFESQHEITARCLVDNTHRFRRINMEMTSIYVSDHHTQNIQILSGSVRWQFA